MKYVLIIYLIHMGLVITHEIGHTIIAKHLINSCEEICIGNGLYIINLSKIKISPIIFSAHVEVNGEALLESKIYKIILFFVMGPMMNLLVALLLHIFHNETVFMQIAREMGRFYFVLGLFPVKGSDLNSMIKVIRHKRKYNL